MTFKWFDRNVEAERKKIGRATWKGAEELLTVANRSVPHDEGTLEGSGIVTQGGLSGMPQTVYEMAKAGQEPKEMFKFDFAKEQKFYISYNTPYAIRLHENPQYDFRNGREGKWLENAAKRSANRISRWIKDEIR